MVLVFASTAGLTGLELGIAGGSAVVGQKLLEAIFGEDAVRRLADEARIRLHQRCETMMDDEARRFLALLEPVRPPDGEDLLRRQAERLGALAAAEGAR
jgi:hypothetical protein